MPLIVNATKTQKSASSRTSNESLPIALVFYIFWLYQGMQFGLHS
jgi:hypothetical protein